MRALVLLFLASTTLACPASLPAPATGDGARETAASIEGATRAAIIATSRDFSARYERGDAAGMVALYTSDGVILPPGRPAMRGAAALTEFWTLRPGVRVLEHRATADSIVVVGSSVAYDWGTYRVRTQDAAGASRETGGKYVIVWRETAPGTWRMHVDMWNAGPPSPSPAR